MAAQRAAAACGPLPPSPPPPHPTSRAAVRWPCQQGASTGPLGAGERRGSQPACLLSPAASCRLAPASSEQHRKHGQHRTALHSRAVGLAAAGLAPLPDLLPACDWPTACGWQTALLAGGGCPASAPAGAGGCGCGWHPLVPCLHRAPQAPAMPLDCDTLASTSSLQCDSSEQAAYEQWGPGCCRARSPGACIARGPGTTRWERAQSCGACSSGACIVWRLPAFSLEPQWANSRSNLGTMSMFQRLASYLLNQVLVEGLANRY